MLTPNLISAGIGGAGALASIGIGLFQRAKARELEKKTIRPVYKTPSEVFLNQKISQKQASEGIDETTYNTSLNNINRNVSAGLDTLSKQRNGLAGIGNIVASASDATLNLGLQDDAVKKANLATYMQQNQNVADYEDKAFQYNEADKYAEVMNKISQMRGAANSSINSGASGLTGMAMSLANTQNTGAAAPPKTKGSLSTISKNLNLKQIPQ